jgi:uncharacterized membrane protein
LSGLLIVMDMNASPVANLLTLVVIICGLGFVASWAYCVIHLMRFWSAWRRSEELGRSFRRFLAGWLAGWLCMAGLFAAAYALTLG